MQVQLRKDPYDTKIKQHATYANVSPKSISCTLPTRIELNKNTRKTGNVRTCTNRFTEYRKHFVTFSLFPYPTTPACLSLPCIPFLDTATPILFTGQVVPFLLISHSPHSTIGDHSLNPSSTIPFVPHLYSCIFPLHHFFV